MRKQTQNPKEKPHNVLLLEDLNERAATDTLLLMRCLHNVIFKELYLQCWSLEKDGILQDVTLF